MSQTGYASVIVRVLDPSVEYRVEQRLFSMVDVPSRSRLYGLAPREAGTLWGESLTSYLTRLAWRYRVPPRVLIAQELAPRLMPRQLAAAKWERIRSFNGNEPLALESAAILETLTKRSDIHLLTVQAWVGDFPMRRSLRECPAWCPVCYAIWKEQGLPLYEPLLWMLKMALICPRHKSWLEDRCPACNQRQSFLKGDIPPGHCIHCKTWLGKVSHPVGEQQGDAALLDWQEWVFLSLEELQNAFVSSGRLVWEQFFTNLVTSCEGWGERAQLAKMAGLTRSQLTGWLDQSVSPSLENLVEFCYVYEVTPLQIMRGNLTPLRHILHSRVPARRPQPQRFVRPVDRKRCLALLQAVLEGRAKGFGNIHQIARHLGYSSRSLIYHFPEICNLLALQAQNEREHRKEQRCQEVRQAVVTLHQQGIFPSFGQVSKLLASPNTLYRPEVYAAWHAARRELGLEP